MNLSNMQNVSYFNNNTDRANIILNIVARMCLTYSYMDEVDIFKSGTWFLKQSTSVHCQPRELIPWK